MIEVFCCEVDGNLSDSFRYSPRHFGGKCAKVSTTLLAGDEHSKLGGRDQQYSDRLIMIMHEGSRRTRHSGLGLRLHLDEPLQREALQGLPDRCRRSIHPVDQISFVEIRTWCESTTENTAKEVVIDSLPN